MTEPYGVLCFSASSAPSQFRTTMAQGPIPPVIDVTKVAKEACLISYTLCTLQCGMMECISACVIKGCTFNLIITNNIIYAMSQVSA